MKAHTRGLGPPNPSDDSAQAIADPIGGLHGFVVKALGACRARTESVDCLRSDTFPLFALG